MTPQKEITLTNPIPLKNDIVPGTNKAVLTLADGSTILLDDIANGVIASQGSSKVIKTSSGTLTYQQAIKNTSGVTPSPARGGEGSGPLTNTMSTPRGGQYQLTLPDGTKVWLNAESSITYPTAFIGKERSVSIKGEVYFQVAKDKSKPFKVKSQNEEILVLGTEFNINAYTNEPAKVITLVEGSIKVNTTVLKPGNSYSEGKIYSANIQQVTAWKNGIFNFNNADIQTIMRQLSRWYDVEVQYEGKTPERRFKGEIGRDLNLSDVLDGLKSADVRFRINGKKIIVLP